MFVLISKQRRCVVTSAVCERDPQIIHAFNDRVSRRSPYECPDREDKIVFFYFYFCHLEMQDKAADKCDVEFSVTQTDIPCVSKGMPT